MGFKTIRYEQPVKRLFTLRPNIAHLSNLNSVHVNKVAVQLNNAMSLTTGMVRSTPFQWLPVLSNIAMPWLRCEVSLFRELKHCWSILFDQLQVVPSIQLRSRSEIWTIDPARWLPYRGSLKKIIPLSTLEALPNDDQNSHKVSLIQMTETAVENAIRDLMASRHPY
jgi:hypothetical protein